MQILRNTFLGLSLGLSALGVVQAAERPNVVVIMVDDMAPMDVSAYNRGLGAVTTPNIDRLAQEGMMVSDYYAQPSPAARQVGRPSSPVSTRFARGSRPSDSPAPRWGSKIPTSPSRSC